MIPFLDVRAATIELREEIDDAIARVLNSGRYILGEEVERFEAAFAAYCEARHCIGVANGLDALELSLRALGIGPGDDVLVPAHTFTATWLAVSAVGARPVPVDPEPGGFNIGVREIDRAMTPAARAVIPVHLYGIPCDVPAIVEYARGAGLRVVEDAAQAHGARAHGRRIGAVGDAVCWSFYPGKNLGALGDGGAVTTDDADLARSIRLLGNYGSRRKYEHECAGVNSRLDPLQAAVLSVKLRHLDAWNDRRRSHAAAYAQALSASSVRAPEAPRWAEPVWHLFVVRSAARDALQDHLHGQGVGTLIHYPIPPGDQPAFSGDPARTPTDDVRAIAREVLSLPMGPQLSDEARARVCDTIVSCSDAEKLGTR